MSKCATDIQPPAAALVHQLRHFIAGGILYNQRAAEQLGMNPTDMQCIHLLELMGPLARQTGGVTVVQDRLEKAGRVRRERNPRDRRGVLIHLESETLQQIAVHHADIDARLGEFLAACPEHDLETVLKFLTRINSLRDTPRPPAGDKLPALPRRQVRNGEETTYEWNTEVCASRL